jgi:hypothetical protein
MPAGLQRVRTARNGDVAFDFAHHPQAVAFNESIKNLGKIIANTRDNPYWDRTVYVGKPIKQVEKPPNGW